MIACTNCNTLLPDGARFCSSCGHPQLPALKAKNTDNFKWPENLVIQANDRLRKRLTERVKAEQDEKKTTAFQERIYESSFRDVIQRRLEQWANAVDLPINKIEEKTALQELDYLIDDLLDFFFVIHCFDLNKVVINDSVLAYQKKEYNEIDSCKMVLDFLNFENEDERIYADFIKLPVKKLRNAGQQFLFPEKDERIWFICDQSLLGNAKEGFAMTEKALYWKSGLQPAQRVYYHKIVSLNKEKEWLLINDLFFNATPSLNTKMIWLLRKLTRLNATNQ